jgi:hypothetical protein
MQPETVDSKPDRLSTDNNAPFGEQIFDICGAQGKSMISPDHICDDFTSEAKAFKAWHGGWNSHPTPIPPLQSANNLAILFATLFQEAA